jgi:hypothetical protein
MNPALLDKEKVCPLYVDYLRECIFQANSFSWEEATITRFCTSGDHKDCPFFRAIDDPGKACDYFTKSQLCEHYKHSDLNGFLTLCNKWCLNDFTSCARYITKKSGEIPDTHLHPDGHMMDAQ